MKKEISALTGLRFIAAFLVFIFHVNLRSKIQSVPWPVYNIISHGAFGVTIFFVLSGFLLAYSHGKDFPEGKLQGASYFGRFMYKRFARIYPVYLVGLLLFAGTGTLFFGRTFFNTTIAADLLMVQAAIPPIAMEWYGSGSWSVSIEIFFYLFFPLLLPLLLRVQRAQILWVILVSVIIIGTVGGLWHKFWPEIISFSLVYANPLFRCSEFIAGMVASLLVFRFGFRTKEWQVLAAIAIGSTYLAMFAPKMNGFVPHNWIILPIIVILLAGIVDVSKTKILHLLAHPRIVYAGRVSYCFYIAQLPLFSMQDILLGRQKGDAPLIDGWALRLFSMQGILHGQPAILPWWTGFLTFIVTCFLAVLLHHFIEVPAHRWLMPGCTLPRLVSQ